MEKKFKRLVLFLLIFVSFFLFVKLSLYLKDRQSLTEDNSIMSSGLLFALLLSLLLWNKNGDDTEGFWDITPPATCSGGPYFWQGDNENSKMCKELASTPEGRIAISSYNCPIGYVGRPGLPFYYSPLSDDQWTNERCEDRPTCPGVDVGLCGMEKQVE